MNEEDIKLCFHLFKQMSSQECIDHIHNCLSHVGCVDISNATEALCKNRRTIYQQMDNKKLPEINIGKHRFPCINPIR